MNRREFLFWNISATGALVGKRVIASPDTLTDEQMEEIVRNHPGIVSHHCRNIGTGVNCG